MVNKWISDCKIADPKSSVWSCLLLILFYLVLMCICCIFSMRLIDFLHFVFQSCPLFVSEKLSPVCRCIHQYYFPHIKYFWDISFFIEFKDSCVVRYYYGKQNCSGKLHLNASIIIMANFVYFCWTDMILWKCQTVYVMLVKNFRSLLMRNIELNRKKSTNQRETCEC